MEQKIELLAGDDAFQVEKRRKWVREYPEAQHEYETVGGKIELLRTILNKRRIEPHDTWMLQNLGITFGDILLQTLNLTWVMVEDEYGRDPALMVPGTSILLFPLTAISKRIEKGEDVDIQDLLDGFVALVNERKALEGPSQ